MEQIKQEYIKNVIGSIYAVLNDAKVLKKDVSIDKFTELFAPEQVIDDKEAQRLAKQIRAIMKRLKY